MPITSSHFKKAPPPKTGPAFGDWAGRDIDYVTLPGGSVMTFDLSRLTLNDYRSMRHHPQINASLSILGFMIHQLDWWIECENKKIKEQIEFNLREKWSQLIRGLSQAHWAGYSPCVLEYENNKQSKYIEITRIKDLLPEDCAPKWKEVEGYAPPGQAKPKFKEYDGIRHGHQLGIYGWTYFGRTINEMEPNQAIPPENTFWYPMLMENGDYRGKKLLKPAFTPWYFSTLVHLFANRYYERFGEPTPIGRAPLETSFDPGDGSSAVPARQAMLDILSNLRSRGVVVLPNDRSPEGNNDYEWDIKYLESQMRGADFERYMQRLDEEMSLGIFTPILMFKTGDVGSNNLGVQHAQTFLWMLNALAADMKEYIDAYIVNRLKDFNWGPNAPKAQWQWKPLGKENVETIRAIITELVRGGTVKPDLEELGKAVGMTLKEIKLVTADPGNNPADDPSGDNKPEDDGRTGRARPDQKRESPRGTDEPRATGKNISARVRAQVTRAYKDGRPLKVDLGYRRQMIGSLERAGFAYPEPAADDFYASMQEYVDNLTDLGHEGYEGPSHFMEVFDRLMESELDRLLDAR